MSSESASGLAARRFLAALLLVGFATLPPGIALGATLRTQTVEERVAPEWGEFHGFVRARTRVDVIAQVMGRVKAVHVKAGQRVAAGDLLVELDDAELRARVLAAEARQAAAEALEAEADQALRRIQSLSSQGAATREELDGATARQKSTRAAVEAAKAQVREGRESLRHAEVRSPIPGVVVDKRVNPGDFSVPGLAGAQGFATGPTLMTLYDPEALWFEAGIPERFAGVVAVGSRCLLEVGPSRRKVEAPVVEVVPGVDDSARTLLVRVDLPASPDLRLGLFGRVRLQVGERKVVEAPSDALVARGQLDTAFVVADGRARLRLVRPGRRTETGTEILSGLKPGERVVLNPPEDLRDGDPVDDGSTRK